MPDPQNTPRFFDHEKLSGPSGPDFRAVKATLPSAEFGAVQWAAKRAGPGHQSLPLAEFLRAALIAAVREVVREEIKRGKNVPADIAAVADEKRKTV